MAAWWEGLKDSPEFTAGLVSSDALQSAYAPNSRLSRSPARTSPVQPTKTMVTAFQSGHGWTGSNLGTITANDTSDIGLGTQSAKVVTTSTNTSGTYASPVVTAIDGTAKDIKLLIKVEGLANLVDLRFYAGDSTLANAKNFNLIPVETGGSDFNYIKEGEWNWVTFIWDHGSNIGTPSSVRNALTKFQFRIQATNGTTATLHLGAVALVPETTLFPNGVVSFTYDDGRATGLTLGRQKLDQYGWSATAFPIRDRIGGGSYVSLAQLQAAHDLSGWEMGCHADTAADHDAGFTTLTAAQIEADLLADRQWLYDNGLGLGEGFAWPRGMSNKATEDVVAKVCAYGRANNTTSRETYPPANPMRIRSYNCGPTTSLATLQTFVTAAVAAKGWLCLTFHEVVTSASTSLEVNRSVHDGIIDYVAGLGSGAPAVLPMIDVLRYR